jgi:hypothetical protein
LAALPDRFYENTGLVDDSEEIRTKENTDGQEGARM